MVGRRRQCDTYTLFPWVPEALPPKESDSPDTDSLKSGIFVIILLDEYDTPMQEAYVNGYWEELVSFTRSLFNSTFKTNPHLERAIMTGITRVSKTLFDIFISFSKQFSNQTV